MFLFFALLRLGNDDQMFLTKLIGEYERLIVAMARKAVRNPEDAADIASEVYLALTKHATKLRRKSTPELLPYIVTVTKHKIIDHYRKEVQAGRRISYDEIAFLLPDRTVNVEEHVLRNELLDQIDAAIDALPIKQQLAVILYCYLETDYRTISQIIGIAPSGFHQYLHRAKNKIREALKKEEYQ